MKRLFLSFAVGALSLFITSGAMAVGLGGYGAFDYSAGITDIKHRGSHGTDTDGSINNIVAGGGLAFDTNLMGPSVFNYRLKIGGDKFYHDGESDFEGAGFHAFNTFGFRLFGNSRVRLWLGPGFGFRYITGDSTGGWGSGLEDIGVVEDYYSWTDQVTGDPSIWIGNYGIHKATASYTLYGIEAGLVIGMNFAVSNVVVISAEVAGKYLFMTGERSRTVTTLVSLTELSNPLNPLPMDLRSSKERIQSHCGAVNITLGILFRFGEGSDATAGRKG